MDADTSRQNYKILPWKAEFADPSVERRYRKRIMVQTVRELRIAVFVWALLLLLFAFNDYTIFGHTTKFFLSLLSRILVSGPLFIFFFVLGRRPQLAVTGTTVTAMLIYGFTFFFLLYFLYPREIIPYVIMVTVVMLISLFVFLPNRIVFASLAGLYAIIGTTVCVALVTPANAGTLVGLFIVLLLPSTVGVIVAYRLHMTRRMEFSALTRAETYNAELLKEIDLRRELERKLEIQATTDPLTGVYNRRFYETIFDHEAKRARRHGNPLALCILDLDHFKDVNDTFGHATGDEVLRLVAQTCLQSLRDSDVLGRLGGEEFVILFPYTNTDGAVTVSDRLRQQLAELDIKTDDERFRVTATFGVTELQPDDRSIADVIRRADAALYRGKSEGRNRVVAA